MKPLITVFVIVDELLQKAGHHDHAMAQASDAELLTVATVAAKFFHHNHERALLTTGALRWICGAAARASRRGILSWERWASNSCRQGPTSALRSNCTPH